MYLTFRGVLIGALFGAVIPLILQLAIYVIGRDLVAEIFRGKPALAAIYLALLWFPVPISTLIGGVIGLLQERDRRQGRR